MGPVLSNSPFTPGFPLHHVGLARQFDKRPEDTVLFQSDFAKQLETERRMSSIPMTDPQSETNQNQIKTMDTVVSQAQAQAQNQAQAQAQPQEQAQVQAQLQTQQPQVQSPVRQLPNLNVPSTVPFIPIPQGADQNPVRVTITGTRPKSNTVASPAAWRNPVQDITLESNTTGNDTTITKVNDDRVASDMDFTSDFTFTDNISQPVQNEGASAPPLERTNRPPYIMGPDELNFRTEFGEMAYDPVMEMERLRLDRGNPVPERTAPVSPQGPNPFVVP